MTSMIDVVFQLLIFFVCAAALQVREDLLPTPLAEGGVATVQPAVRLELVPVDEIWVHLLRDGTGETRIRLNDAEYADWGKLRNTLRALAQIAPESPVILEIAADVPAGEMIRLYDVCRSAGFTQLNFNAHDPAANSGSPGKK